MKVTTRNRLVFKRLVVILQKFIIATSINRITLKFKTMKQIYKNLALLVIMGAALVGCSKKVDNPKPSVKAISGNGFVSDSKKVNPNTTVKFGFDAASNAQTNQSLSKFRVFISGEPNTNTVIYDTVFTLNDEKTFHFEGEFIFAELGRWQIVGRAFDAAGEEGSAYIDITVLMENSFTWKKAGDTLTGFGDYGLIWDEGFAQDTICLTPTDTMTTVLLKLSTTEWNNIYTEAHKRLLFNDIRKNYNKEDQTKNEYKKYEIETYKGILTKKETATYNDVLVVYNKDDDEKNLLLYINNSYAEDYNGQLYLTVHGKLK